MDIVRVVDGLPIELTISMGLVGESWVARNARARSEARWVKATGRSARIAKASDGATIPSVRSVEVTDGYWHDILLDSDHNGNCL